ncbi:MAG: hypothetical protein DRP64_03465 [Verrucomicrobia bacterium]|nr:MAG: hypothetical protein DRP64_03465 [Verrucomicrobiota bacterium]
MLSIYPSLLFRLINRLLKYRLFIAMFPNGWKSGNEKVQVSADGLISGQEYSGRNVFSDRLNWKSGKCNRRIFSHRHIAYPTGRGLSQKIGYAHPPAHLRRCEFTLAHVWFWHY